MAPSSVRYATPSSERLAVGMGRESEVTTRGFGVAPTRRDFGVAPARRCATRRAVISAAGSPRLLPPTRRDQRSRRRPHGAAEQDGGDGSRQQVRRTADAATQHHRRPGDGGRRERDDGPLPRPPRRRRAPPRTSWSPGRSSGQPTAYDTSTARVRRVGLGDQAGQGDAGAPDRGRADPRGEVHVRTSGSVFSRTSSRVTPGASSTSRRSLGRSMSRTHRSVMMRCTTPRPV